MTQQHPITPPPELRTQWRQDAPRYRDSGVGREDWLMDRAAQWGADAELEACCEWIAAYPWLDHPELLIKQLRAARRPNPPSLKEQALQALSEAVKMADDTPPEGICSDQADIIRRALEQLDD
jgi:hypothetical protein